MCWAAHQLTLLIAVAQTQIAAPKQIWLHLPGHAAERVEIYVAARDDGSRKPAVLFVHGHQAGGRPGAQVFVRVERRPQLATIDEGRLVDLAAAGFVAAAVSMPGYGGSSGPSDFSGPRTQNAIEAALEFLRKRPDVDPSRIALYGVSRGAIAASMVATRTRWLNRLILVAGSYDIEDLYNRDERIRDAISREAGRDPDDFAARSALKSLGTISARTLVLHGSMDTAVHQARELALRLQQSGTDVQLHIFKNFSHQIPIPEQYQLITPFLQGMIDPPDRP